MQRISAKFVPRWLTDEREERQFLAAKTELCSLTLVARRIWPVVLLLVSDNETAAMTA